MTRDDIEHLASLPLSRWSPGDAGRLITALLVARREARQRRRRDRLEAEREALVERELNETRRSLTAARVALAMRGVFDVL